MIREGESSISAVGQGILNEDPTETLRQVVVRNAKPSETQMRSKMVLRMPGFVSQPHDREVISQRGVIQGKGMGERNFKQGRRERRESEWKLISDESRQPDQMWIPMDAAGAKMFQAAGTESLISGGRPEVPGLSRLSPEGAQKKGHKSPGVLKHRRLHQAKVGFGFEIEIEVGHIMDP